MTALCFHSGCGMQISSYFSSFSTWVTWVNTPPFYSWSDPGLSISAYSSTDCKSTSCHPDSLFVVRSPSSSDCMMSHSHLYIFNQSDTRMSWLPSATLSTSHSSSDFSIFYVSSKVQCTMGVGRWLPFGILSLSRLLSTVDAMDCPPSWIIIIAAAVFQESDPMRMFLWCWVVMQIPIRHTRIAYFRNSPKLVNRHFVWPSIVSPLVVHSVSACGW